MAQEKNQAWGGRFQESTDAFVQEFTASVNVDRRMYAQDIAGSRAHAQMLAEQGILSEEDALAIERGLDQIEAEIAQGRFEWSLALEDVHMNIEHRLTELIGAAGKRLHTGRSRNDQVATDLRLYAKSQLQEILAEILRLQEGIVGVADREATTVMPGFTHLQVAQPVTFGHHLLAWFEMLKRDFSRFCDAGERLNECPLGAAALAGTTFPIDRRRTAELLGFRAPCANSLDAVSDRDFAIELCAAAAICMMHLSRFSEELIIWNSAAYRFVDLPDRFCTGSSIMPQKKNPDVPELVRGKSGRIFGHVQSLLTLMKGQPLAYNKDNQEDKESLFDTFDQLLACLCAFADMIPALQANHARMREAAQQGFATATDFADYLVRHGVPFRDAHEMVGKAVHLGIESGRDLSAFSLNELQAIAPMVDESVFACLSLEGSLAARNHEGATAPQQVRQALVKARQWLEDAKQSIR